MFFQNIADGFSAFLNDPVEWFKNPAATTINYQVKKATTGGETKIQINQDLGSSDVLWGSPISAVGNALDSLKKWLGAWLPVIFIGVVIIALAYLVFSVKGPKR